MKIFQLISSLLAIIAQVARHPLLADNKVATKTADLIADLTDTASALLARGEEGLEALKAFKAKVKLLRERLNAGELPTDELLTELGLLKERSDAAHQQLQDLKPGAGGANDGGDGGQGGGADVAGKVAAAAEDAGAAEAEKAD